MTMSTRNSPARARRSAPTAWLPRTPRLGPGGPGRRQIGSDLVLEPCGRFLLPRLQRGQR